MPCKDLMERSFALCLCDERQLFFWLLILATIACSGVLYLMAYCPPQKRGDAKTMGRIRWPLGNTSRNMERLA